MDNIVIEVQDVHLCCHTKHVTPRHHLIAISNNPQNSPSTPHFPTVQTLKLPGLFCSIFSRPNAGSFPTSSDIQTIGLIPTFYWNVTSDNTHLNNKQNNSTSSTIWHSHPQSFTTTPPPHHHTPLTTPPHHHHNLPKPPPTLLPLHIPPNGHSDPRQSGCVPERSTTTTTDIKVESVAPTFDSTFTVLDPDW